MTAPSRAATSARRASVAAALAILATLLVWPALGPSGARAMGPLPDCRYADILTSPRGYADWAVTLVDTILRVPKGYVPPDLVGVADLGIPGHGKVRSVMAGDLKSMSAAAKAAGAAIGVVSAYRSYGDQQQVFNSWVSRFGYTRALQVSARPGHSEHQLGLAIDFRSSPPDDLQLATQWAGTPAGKWMKAHAWEYGFLMSYPKGGLATVCYDYEPWHFRYVGRSLAALIHDSGLTVREYLWAHFTTTVVPPPTKAPGSTPKPTAKPAATPVAPPTPSMAPSPTAEPSATAAPAASAGATAPGTPLATSPPTPGPSAAPGVVGAAPGVAAAAAAGAALLVVVLGLGMWFTRRRGRA